jgi:hypothetical protein
MVYGTTTTNPFTPAVIALRRNIRLETLGVKPCKCLSRNMDGQLLRAATRRLYRGRKLDKGRAVRRPRCVC